MESYDGDVMEPRVKRKGSMLKKTFKAIGKVKPKFKKNKNLNHNMELLNSCGSLDFDLSAGEDDDDSSSSLENGDEEVDGDGDVSSDENEDGNELEKSSEREHPRDDKEDITSTNTNTEHEATRVVTPMNHRSGSSADESDDTPPSSPETPPSRRASRLAQPSMMNIVAQLDANDVTSEILENNEKTKTPKRSSTRSSRKSGSGKKSGGSRSPVPPTGTPKSRSRKPGQAPAASFHHPENSSSPGPRSPRKEPASPKMEMSSCSPRASHSELKLSTKSLIQDLPLHLPNCIPEEGEDDDDDDDDDDDNNNKDDEGNGESLKRLSVAFGDDSAMGGYFAKLQEIKHKDPAKPHSFSTPMEQSPSVSKPGSARELGKGKDDNKGSRSFKPSKNIKKLLGLKRAESTHEKSTASKKGGNIVPESKDEAAKLMLEFSTMLSSKKVSVDNGDRPMKAHTTRPTRTFVFDETDDESTSSEFPEIPSEKRTSLSDIRRMMDTSKEGPQALTKHQSSSRKSSHHDSRSTKIPRDGLNRRLSIEKPNVDVDKNKSSQAVQKTEKGGQSPTDVTDFPTNPQATGIDENDKPTNNPSPAKTSTDEKLLSPRSSRKHRIRTTKKIISDDSGGNKKSTSTTGESSTKNVAKELEELLDIRQTPSASQAKPRQRGTSSSPTNDDVGENGEETEASSKKENSSSRGAARSRKTHCRQGDKRQATGTQSRSEGRAPDVIEDASQAVNKRTETVESGNLAKDSDYSSPRRRSRKVDLKGRASPEMKQHRAPRASDRKMSPDRLVCTISVGLPSVPRGPRLVACKNIQNKVLPSRRRRVGVVHHWQNPLKRASFRTYSQTTVSTVCQQMAAARCL